MFNKDGREQKGTAAVAPRQGAGDFAIVLPSGPGAHGFSGDPQKYIASGIPEVKTGSVMEGDIDLMFDKNGTQAVVEVPSGDSAQESYHITEVAADSAAPVSENDGRFFMIIHHDEHGVPDISRFDNETEAQAFVEELLSQGMDGDSIEACESSNLPFTVSSRPVVNFQSR